MFAQKNRELTGEQTFLYHIHRNTHGDNKMISDLVATFYDTNTFELKVLNEGCIKFGLVVQELYKLFLNENRGDISVHDCAPMIIMLTLQEMLRNNVERVTDHVIAPMVKRHFDRFQAVADFNTPGLR